VKVAQEPRKYDYLNYNRHDVLRPSWRFWGMALFLSRHLLLLLLLGISHGKKGGGPPNPGVAALIDPLFFVSDVPALILLCTLGARLPGSGRLPRFLWRNGRVLLIASCALYLGLLFWQQGADLASWHPVTWAMVALTVVVAASVSLSTYLRDLFAQFPDRPSEGD
jgi:hypothetical protein